MRLADVPPDGSVVRFETGPEENLPSYSVVGFVWDGDFCFGTVDGWVEVPWATWVADLAEYGYTDVRIATGWKPVDA